MARTQWCAATLLVAVLAGLAGCSTTREAPPPAPATVHEGWAGCDVLGAFRGYSEPNETPGMGDIPSDFTPVAAVLCEAGQRPGNDARTTTVLVDLERRATEIQVLLTYLARPSEISTDPDIACQAMAWFRPWLFLLDADGRWVYPQIPTDPCGFALDLFDEEELHWATLPYTDTVVRVRSDR